MNFIKKIDQSFDEFAGNSLFLSYILTIFVSISKILRSSKIINWFSQSFAMLKQKFSQSFCYRVFSEPNGRVDKSFKNGIFYWIIINITLAIKWLFDLIFSRTALMKSIAIAIMDRAYILVSLIIMLASIMPHHLWNNALIVAIAVAFNGVYLIARSKEEIIEDFKNLNITVYFMLLMVVLAMLTSFSPMQSLKTTIFMLSCISIGILTIFSIKDEEALKKLLFWVAVALFLGTLYGFYSKLAGINIYISENKDSSDGIKVGRMFAAMGNPNNFAQYLIMFIPVAIASFFSQKGIVKKLFLSIVILSSSLALVLTYSRSAWVGLFLAIVVFLALYDFRFVPVMVIGAILIFPILPSTISARIMSILKFSKDSSFSHRENIWSGANAMLNEHWYNGIGIGSDVFAGVYSEFGKLTLKGHLNRAAEMKDYIFTDAAHAHNLYLEIWLEMGIFGIISFLMLIFKNLISSINVLIFTKDSAYKLYLSIFIGLFVGILSMGFVEYTWFYPRIMLFFWILLGVFMRIINLAYEKNKSMERDK